MNIKEDANYVFSFRFYLLLISILILIFMTLNNIIKNKKSNGAKLTGKNNIAA
jgi:competence protein ComGC